MGLGGIVPTRRIRETGGPTVLDMAAVADGQVLTRSGTTIVGAAAGGVTDHGGLTGLLDDDHTQYALLAGRAGGQTLIGGTAAGDDLVLRSTSDATKGKVIFGLAGTTVYDEVNERFGIGTATPGVALDVSGLTIRVFAATDPTLLASASAASSRSTLSLIAQSASAQKEWRITNELGDDLIFRDATLGLTRMVIDGVNGNVGIGTVSPNALLDVRGAPGASVGGFPSGSLHLTSPSALENANAVITGHNLFGGNKQLWYLGSTSSSNDDIAFINRQGGRLSLNAGGAARLIVETGGNVGIGLAGAGEKLVVNGNVRLNGDFDFLPNANNTGEVGTDALRFNRVRATTVVTGDLELRDDARAAHWVLREEPDRITAVNRITGHEFEVMLRRLP